MDRRSLSLKVKYSLYSQKVLSRFKGGARTYVERLDDIVDEGDVCLHLGCGHDIERLYKRYESKATVHGIDPDFGAVKNYPGESWHGLGEKMPFGDGVYDVVFSEYVLEHLERPEKVFSEVSRVLKPGGFFVSLAPNFYSYKSLIAHITPLSFHRFMVGMLRPDTPRSDEDVYPTVYRANSYGDVLGLSRTNGMQLVSLLYVNNGPTWFQRIPIVFEMGLIFHYILELRIFRVLRCTLVSLVRKSGSGDRQKYCIRCVQCGNSQMERQEEDYLCTSCTGRYHLERGVWRMRVGGRHSVIGSDVL